MLLCLVECLDCSNGRLKLNERVICRTFGAGFFSYRCEGLCSVFFLTLSLSLVFELSRVSIQSHLQNKTNWRLALCFKCVFRSYSETLSPMKQMARVSWLEAQRKEHCIFVQVFCVIVPEFCVVFTSCSRIITTLSPFVIILKLKPTSIWTKNFFSGSKDKEKRLPCVHRPY